MYNVIVVDDSLVIRELLSDIINSIDGFRVVDSAENPFDAREKIKKHNPDLVTIDIDMPKMDGLTFLKNLMKLHPMPAIIISSYDKKDDVFRLGAKGFLKKSNNISSEEFKKSVIEAIQKISYSIKRYNITKNTPKEDSLESIRRIVEKRFHPDEILKSEPQKRPLNEKLVAIGASTGGVDALVKIFSKLELQTPPILIVQHIPPNFSKSFAERLNRLSKISVKEAENGDILQNSHAYLSPGDIHLTIERIGSNLVVKLLDADKVNRHKPSVDILMRSVNNIVGKSALGIILTGMGDDGAIGMRELYLNGATTIAQDEASCIVYGMPKQVVDNGSASKILPLDNIADFIMSYSKG